MKAAAAVLYEEDYTEISTYGKLPDKVKGWLECSRENGADVVVLPALIGSLYGDAEKYLDDTMKLSLDYKDIHICPGSFYEKAREGTYHSSCLIKEGSIILKQRQIYLAKWEKSLGLKRGTELNYAYVKGLKTALIISTDLFYPQVSRAAAMSGAELVLAPAAVKAGRNIARQLSGLWQNVQQNLFFAVESGFKGSFGENEFYSRSIIHGPLELTEDDTGFLALEEDKIKNAVIYAELDNKKRKLSVEKFNALAQLNPEFYRDAPFFG